MAKRKFAQEGPGLVDQLKAAIQGSGMTLNQIMRLTGVDAGRLSRFLRGERTITLTAAEKICTALHLQLNPVREGPPAGEPKRRKPKGDA